ncbi:putative pyridoxamine 5'-phosphate oxidase family protein [Breznakia sp. PF5-3]|uniref:pyridoxamine 5'-phosphate oxidase family protein n=1 Tax=unclassified Breznakia TaxID=2623764 RepID=UPI00240712C1|nr:MULTISPECIES: pyridoxamine 5'-phosphate oxidase family protein [unclassified Breznakia]MDL2276914.1 pyridoxamine 5'-phosphate oxidase family protein [Breznakia sp. OttesenSCG-928-G09]MDF9824776.1 putative pyridoxamine 5'-phosphate oxidase family protein [Breznakia sp. PM6-1]MDF9835768.1 putative pyridoxamine 5'-phosphate oxidase family protein [Breznakia sp. PF5-3]MDF9837854.1 putative pyridoxamine 5'-phosphate oxidase family protein [Breznakia sp. PFB2-8]MDF9859775.1 putative pyridoxamine 
MNYLDIFYQTMEEAKNIAVATSIKDKPHVRIMDFVYDKDKNIIYIATFKNNTKVNEFKENPNVSFTTLPTQSQKHVRSIDAIVKKSETSIFDIADAFIQKNPEFKNTLDMAGPMLDVFEIHSNHFTVIPDIKNAKTITI